MLGKLRRKLEQMRELRDLVRSLGRSGGKGPKRLAPQRVRTLLRPGELSLWVSLPAVLHSDGVQSL